MSSRRLPRVRSLLRGLVAVVAICGVTFGVSACETKPGAAAFVGDDRISESEVTPYVTGAAAAAENAAPQQPPRNFVVGVLILEQVWTNYLRSVDAMPTDAQLTASRDAALAGQEATAPTEAQLRAALVEIGVDASFTPNYTRQAELQYFVTEKASAEGIKQADFAKVVSAATPSVRLSPRYGTWNASTLAIDGSTPDYLKLTPTTSA